MKKIDAYITRVDEFFENDYCMYFKYNGLNFNELTSEAVELAKDFSNSIVSDRYLYTMIDSNYEKSGLNKDVLVFGVRGLENIDDALISIIDASIKAEADFCVSFNGTKFLIVSSSDKEKYIDRSLDGNSRKAFSSEELVNLDNEINKIYSEEEFVKYGRC